MKCIFPWECRNTVGWVASAKRELCPFNGEWVRMSLSNRVGAAVVEANKTGVTGSKFYMATIFTCVLNDGNLKYKEFDSLSKAMSWVDNILENVGVKFLSEQMKLLK